MKTTAKRKPTTDAVEIISSTLLNESGKWSPDAIEHLVVWPVKTIAARGRRFARLDAMASNAALCRYYEERGFRPLGTTTLFGSMYTARLFEQELRPT